jgi:hypothetical protein
MGPFKDHGYPLKIVVLKDALKDFIIGKVESFIDNKEALLNSGHCH